MIGRLRNVFHYSHPMEGMLEGYSADELRHMPPEKIMSMWINSDSYYIRDLDGKSHHRVYVLPSQIDLERGELSLPSVVRPGGSYYTGTMAAREFYPGIVRYTYNGSNGRASSWSKLDSGYTPQDIRNQPVAHPQDLVSVIKLSYPVLLGTQRDPISFKLEILCQRICFILRTGTYRGAGIPPAAQAVCDPPMLYTGGVSAPGRDFAPARDVLILGVGDSSNTSPLVTNLTLKPKTLADEFIEKQKHRRAERNKLMKLTRLSDIKMPRQDGTSSALSLPRIMLADTVASFTDVLATRALATVKDLVKEQISNSVFVDTGSQSQLAPRVMLAFDDWYAKTISDRFQRTFDLVMSREDESIGCDNFYPSAKPPVVQSFGNNKNTRTLWFPWNGRVYWANTILGSSPTGDKTRFQTIEFCTYGRSKKPLAELLEFFVRYWKDVLEVPPQPTSQKRIARDIQVFKPSGSSWGCRGNTPGRMLESVIISEEVRQVVVDRITWWQVNKEWYTTRGFPYKITYILEGEAGCGKSTLARALSTHFFRPLYQIHLPSISSDDQLQSLVAEIPQGSILLIEEFDACDALLDRVYRERSVEEKRRKMEQWKRDNPEALNDAIPGRCGVTLGGMLEMLDGVEPLNNLIVIMTTNTLRHIDPALRRDGRVDEIVTLTPMDDVRIREFITKMFPDDTIPEGLVFAPIPGAKLQKIYFNNRDNFLEFMEAIPKQSK